MNRRRELAGRQVHLNGGGGPLEPVHVEGDPEHGPIPLFAVSATPYEGRDVAPPLGRLDLARQPNLSTGYTPPGGGVGIAGRVQTPVGGD